MLICTNVCENIPFLLRSNKSDLRAFQMNFRFTSYFLFVCTAFAVVLSRNFEIQPNEFNDTFILSQIISNYIRRYLSHELIFISLVHASSKKSFLRFHKELITDLFHNSNLTDFSYNTGSALFSRPRLRRNGFNVIFVDIVSLMRQVYLTFNSKLIQYFDFYFKIVKL